MVDRHQPSSPWRRDVGAHDVVFRAVPDHRGSRVAGAPDRTPTPRDVRVLRWVAVGNTVLAGAWWVLVTARLLADGLGTTMSWVQLANAVVWSAIAACHWYVWRAARDRLPEPTDAP